VILLLVSFWASGNLEPKVREANFLWVAIPIWILIITGTYQFVAIVLVICWRVLKFLFG